jgi:DNA-binding beta-propeller fold protein YncE
LAVLAVMLVFGCGGGVSRDRTIIAQTATVELPNVEGRFDHFSVDVEGKRLFAAALGNDSLEVIDIAKNKGVQSIPGLKKPTGSAWISQLNRLAVASGDDGMCRFFDGSPLKLAGEVKGSRGCG